jgi:2-iminobutanoate/2-iminopropanoate deaminase
MPIAFDNPSAVPAPVGHYSHVARVETTAGTWLYLSGQVAVDAEGSVVGSTVGEQARHVHAAIADILAAHGASYDNVVNMRTYVTDMAEVAELREVRSAFLGDTAPASILVEVSRLVMPELKIEVEVQAYID